MVDLEEMICPCCHRGCSLAYPMCHRGRNYRDQVLRDDEIAELLASAPKCPGCHVGCSLADPQCARGIRFRDMWQAGEEVPERRRPGGLGGPGSRKRPQRPAGANDAERLAMLMGGIIPMILKGYEGDLGPNILESIKRHEGGAAFGTIVERTRGSEDEVYTALARELENGTVRDELMEWGTRFYFLTERGEDMLRRAKLAKQDAYEVLFACWTPEERHQLEELLEKLMESDRSRK